MEPAAAEIDTRQQIRRDGVAGAYDRGVALRGFCARIGEWMGSGKYASPLPNSGHGVGKDLGRPLTVPIIGKEEKRLVFDHRAAKRAAELILHVGRRLPRPLREIWPGIQDLIAEIFIRYAVE